MSDSIHHSNNHKSSEHGSAKSYVIGFVLSLIFTAIPYYLVVEKVIAGNALLATILGIAVIQMFIQILFFLHLGRGPKPLYNVVFFFGTVFLILVVVLGSIFIINNLNYNMSPADVTKKLAQKESIYQVNGEQTGACRNTKINHIVTIQNSKIAPEYTVANICDTISIVNNDSKTRYITFGPHPEHKNYGGESEVTVQKGSSETITLNESGTFIFHDHLDPDVSARFTVNP